MEQFLSILILIVILVTSSQQQEPQCEKSECVIITNCPSFLQLVKKMKSGDHEARKKVMQSQCGFESSLPKVCCNNRSKDGEPQIPRKVETLEKLPAPVALISGKQKKPQNAWGIRQKVEFPSDCGLTNTFSTRIVRGHNAKANAWPWIAALGYLEENTGKIYYLCGASLITKRHLVTAAHCIRDDLVSVLLGEHVIGDDTDGANPEEFRVVKVTKHEKFIKSTFTNDIAIVEIERDVKFKYGIQPVCLPSTTSRLMKDKFVGEGAYIAGWGRTSWRGNRSDVLLQGLLTVISNKQCKKKFEGFPDVNIDDSKICAGNQLDVGACLGDSGGPLVSLEKADDNLYRYHLIGVVSSGYSKCHAVRGFPDVYTRVTEFDQWIKNTVQNS